MPDQPTSASFGAWVRRRRRALDLTQTQLGDLAACTESAIRKIESDDRRPSLRIAERLADALRIAADERQAFIDAARGDARTDRLEDGADVPPPAPGNLPPFAAAIIGREADLRQIAARLADPGSRLLTLTGPGGIGKSRLAMAAGAAQQALRPDGVWFVPLVSVPTEDVLLSTIAQTLGITFGAETSALVQLGAHLRGRTTLLILDNFEHLLGAAGTVVALLEAAPNLKILVTSRERLGVSAEFLMPLDGLACDRDDGEIAPAVQLFCERAQRVRADFPQDHDELAQAAAICRLVGGMPLAIELAAAWVRLLGCEEIHDEISRTLDFLQTSTRDSAPRHASLRAAFQHSMDRVTPEERDVFAALSLFRSPFDREAAQAVAGASLATLAALADKSLIKALGGGRFTVHELLRQYGAEMLAADPASAEMRRLAHADYFNGLLIRNEALLTTGEGVALARRLLPLFPDTRAAFPVLLERGRLDDALTYGHSVLWVYETMGFYGEAVEHYSEVARYVEARPDLQQNATLRTILCHTQAALGVYLFRWGRAEEALRNYEEGARWARTLAHGAGRALALSGMTMARMALGHEEAAQRALEEFLTVPEADILRRRGHDALVATTLGHALALGVRCDGVASFFQKVLDNLRRTNGHPVVLAQMEVAAGDIAHREHRVDGARDHWERALASLGRMAERHPGQVGIAWRLGRLYGQTGHIEEARRHLANAVSIARDCGFVPYIAVALAQLGNMESLLGNHATAISHLEQALAVNQEHKVVRGSLLVSEKLGLALARAGRNADAYAMLRAGVRFALEQSAYASARDMLEHMAGLLPSPPAPPIPDAAQGTEVLQACLASMPVSLPA
jgi:predicted ATPase/DNA-binding XRE family transcriptional regulator